MSLLEVKGLSAYYITHVYGVERDVKVVDNITFSLEENEIMGLAGESGCGKSTLLKVLLSMIKPPLRVLSGEVNYSYDNKHFNLLNLDKKQLREVQWEDISYIPQGSMSTLNPVRKIRKTFEDVIKAHKTTEEKEEYEKLMEEHIRYLGLPLEVLDSYPHQLSGGMRQRTTIALATILKPKIIFADEPTTALDVIVQRGVIQMLKKLHEEQENTMLIVTHDMAVHANVADRIAVMYAGKLVEIAKKEILFTNPKHPYSQFLIRSLPKIGDKKQKISAPGNPPSLANPPSGCRFHPRCPYVKDICKEYIPKFRNYDNSHQIACFLYSDEIEEGEEIVSKSIRS